MLSLSGDIRSLCFLFLTDPSLADVNTCFTSPLKSSIGIWSLSIWCIIFWCWYLFKSPQHSSTYIWSLSLFCRMVFHFQTSIWNSACLSLFVRFFLHPIVLSPPPPSPPYFRVPWVRLLLTTSERQYEAASALFFHFQRETSTSSKLFLKNIKSFLYE